MVVQMMYKFRLYPSSKQKVKLIGSLKTCKVIYNELLALSIDSYKFGKVSLSGFDYNKYLTGKFSEIHSQSKQNVSDRVHKAFANFFRRVKDKSCKEKGFPRFKSRVNSLTFPQTGFKLLSDKRLSLSKVGNIPIVLHRVPKGKIKTLTIKQNKVRQWFAVFSCELPDVVVKHNSTEKVGIDVNSKDNFCFINNGKRVDNPKFLIKSERKLALLQRRLSRKVKGSRNRSKVRFKVAKLQNRIANQRLDFHHKLSSRLTKSYCFIGVEKLDIKSMASSSWNAKFINDAGWNSFINMLSYKAVNCGGQLVKSEKTRGSSHRCSKCGFYVKDMPTSKMVFECPECLNVRHRDLNASINHLNDTVGTDCAKPNACGDSINTIESSIANGIDEAGTINDKV